MPGSDITNKKKIQIFIRTDQSKILPFVCILDIPAHPHLQFMLGLVIVIAVFDVKFC